MDQRDAAKKRHEQAIRRVQGRVADRMANLSNEVYEAVASAPALDSASYRRIMQEVDRSLDKVYPARKGGTSALEGDIVEESVRTRKEVEQPLFTAIAKALDNP